MTRAFDSREALEIVDRTQGGLYNVLLLIDTMDAIAHVCEEPEANISKEQLQSIYRGLAVVIERIHTDVAAANHGVEAMRDMLRPEVHKAVRDERHPTKDRLTSQVTATTETRTGRS